MADHDPLAELVFAARAAEDECDANGNDYADAALFALSNAIDRATEALEALDARIREARGSWGPDNDGANPVVRGMQEARLILRGEKLP